MYDLEFEANENVHTLADTLYWAFLTLTGIGQPYEIVTPAGARTLTPYKPCHIPEPCPLVLGTPALSGRLYAQGNLM